VDLEILDRIRRMRILKEIDIERDRQNRKWGRQRHTDGNWLKILGEEFGEVCQAMQADMGWGKTSDASNKRVELIQLAAVAVAMAEQILEEENQS
jgi:NTP pyrophosphatase (non-canonical NTP hydrolase)